MKDKCIKHGIQFIVPQSVQETLHHALKEIDVPKQKQRSPNGKGKMTLHYLPKLVIHQEGLTLSEFTGENISSAPLRWLRDLDRSKRVSFDDDLLEQVRTLWKKCKQKDEFVWRLKSSRIVGEPNDIQRLAIFMEVEDLLERQKEREMSAIIYQHG